MYAKMIRKLYQVNLFKAKKVDLGNMKAIQQYLPEQKWKAIHVAGTNGKGSVSKKVQASLTASNFKTGLFVSPHISTFRERISVDDCLVEEDFVADQLEYLFKIAAEKQIDLTFFEYLVALGFSYFSLKECDFVAVECGLGGLLDATNILQPEVSVISTIGFDHMESLGNTLELIARNKAGIIKPGIPCIIGPNAEPLSVFKEVANNNNSELIRIEGPFKSYDAENSAIAYETLKILRRTYKIPEARLEANLPCRLEEFDSDVLDRIVLDVAHNPQGLARVRDYCKAINKPVSVFCCFSKGKDVSKNMELILEFADQVTFLEYKHDRLLSKEDLEEVLATYSENPIVSNKLLSVDSTLKGQIERIAIKDSVTVICGSFFFMKAARKSLGVALEEDEVDLNESFIPSHKI